MRWREDVTTTATQRAGEEAERERFYTRVLQSSEGDRKRDKHADEDMVGRQPSPDDAALVDLDPPPAPAAR